MHVTDEILRATGGPTVPEGLLAWYKAGGATSDDLDDAERQFLLEMVRGTIGAEMLGDPNFTSGASWNEGDGWLVFSNKAVIDGSNAAKSPISTSSAPFAGLVLVSVTCITYFAGDFEIGIGAIRPGMWVTNKPGTTRQILDLSGITGAPLIEASIGAMAEFSEFSIKPIAGALTRNWQTNDMWDAYLKSLGYTGAFNDMWLAYWSAQP
jgi:hypothetical protein